MDWGGCGLQTKPHKHFTGTETRWKTYVDMTAVVGGVLVEKMEKWLGQTSRVLYARRA